MDDKISGVMEQPQGTLLSVVLDKEGYVTNFCTGGTLGNETEHFTTDIPEDFYCNYHAYRVENSTLVLDTNRLSDVAAERELAELRMRRESECFSVINRGKLWYDKLTDEQLKDLDEWYQAWLNVTERKRGAKSSDVPTKPKWLE